MTNEQSPKPKQSQVENLKKLLELASKDRRNIYGIEGQVNADAFIVGHALLELADRIDALGSKPAKPEPKADLSDKALLWLKAELTASTIVNREYFSDEDWRLCKEALAFINAARSKASEPK